MKDFLVLYEAKFTKADLKKLTKEEICFFLNACLFLNEVSVLRKFYLASWQKNSCPTDCVIEQKGNHFQALSLLHLICGKLYEAWRLLENNFDVSLKQNFFSTLTEEAKQAHQQLHDYFKKKSALSIIRHNLAFHYPDDQNHLKHIEEMLEHMSDERSSENYCSQNFSNCLFFGAFDFSTFLLLNKLGANDAREGIEKIGQEAFEQVKNFFILFGEIIKILQDKMEVSYKSVSLQFQPPKLSTFKMPYFFDERP